MSGREWKPGDVAMVRNEYDVWNLAICSIKPTGVVWQYGVTDACIPLNADARPVVVIDPEDAEQVKALAAAYRDATHAALTSVGMTLPELRMRAALLSLAEPKPEVYEHLVYQQRGKTAESVCGKAWIPGADVTVVGRCPECQEVARGGWTA